MNHRRAEEENVLLEEGQRTIGVENQDGDFLLRPIEIGLFFD
jgi:hypothetical protein